VLEYGEGVVAVLGFHGFAVQLELRAFQQQQRAAQFSHGILEFRVGDGVQGFFELRGLFPRG
jgi:hypothetical protein